MRELPCTLENVIPGGTKADLLSATALMGGFKSDMKLYSSKTPQERLQEGTKVELWGKVREFQYQPVPILDMCEIPL